MLPAPPSSAFWKEARPFFLKGGGGGFRVQGLGGGVWGVGVRVRVQGELKWLEGIRQFSVGFQGDVFGFVQGLLHRTEEDCYSQGVVKHKGCFRVLQEL